MQTIRVTVVLTDAEVVRVREGLSLREVVAKRMASQLGDEIVRKFGDLVLERPVFEGACTEFSLVLAVGDPIQTERHIRSAAAKRSEEMIRGVHERYQDVILRARKALAEVGTQLSEAAL